MKPEKRAFNKSKQKLQTTTAGCKRTPLYIVTYLPAWTSREGPWMGRTGGRISCSRHGSVFIPGLRECVGCCAGEKPNDRGRGGGGGGGGGGGKKERERGREGRCHTQEGRTEEGVHTRVHSGGLGGMRNSK